jgi:hypothetical protein
MTVSSSLSMLVLASVLSRAAACRARSSLTRAIRSSRVSELRFREDGRTTASNISSGSISLSGCKESLPSPFNTLRAAVGLSSTAVSPPRLKVGVKGDLKSLDARERRSDPADGSRQLSNADFPASHSCNNPRRSAPIDSYCAISVTPRFCSFVAPSRVASDSSRITCIFA